MLTYDDTFFFSFLQSIRPLPRPRITSSDSNQLHAGLPPETNFWSMRMRVEGRVQDFGPAAALSAVSEPNTALGDDDDLLPPDYYQATQPFPHPISAPTPVPPPLMSTPLPTPSSPPLTRGRVDRLPPAPTPVPIRTTPAPIVQPIVT